MNEMIMRNSKMEARVNLRGFFSSFVLEFLFVEVLIIVSQI